MYIIIDNQHTYLDAMQINVLLIIIDTCLSTVLTPLIQTSGLQGTQLCSPIGLPKLKRFLLFRSVNDLFNYNKLKISQGMRRAIEMNSNLTCIFTGIHSRLMVAKYNFKLVGSGTYVLQLTFPT